MAHEEGHIEEPAVTADGKLDFTDPKNKQQIDNMLDLLDLFMNGGLGEMEIDPETQSRLEDLSARVAQDPRFAEQVKSGNVPEVEQTLMSLLGDASATKEGLEKLNKQLELGKFNMQNKGLAQGMQLLADVGGLAAARKQVRDADKALKNLKKPGLPPIPEKSRKLAQDAFNARRDASTAGILESEALGRGYDQDLQAGLDVARTASTGQAGAYTSGAQAAINRRKRDRLKQFGARTQARRQALDRVDRLTARQDAENQRMYQNRMGQFGVNEKRYQTDVARADRLGSIGRQNTINSMQNISRSGGDVFQTMQQARYYDNIMAQNQARLDEIATREGLDESATEWGKNATKTQGMGLTSPQNTVDPSMLRRREYDNTPYTPPGRLQYDEYGNTTYNTGYEGHMPGPGYYEAYPQAGRYNHVYQPLNNPMAEQMRLMYNPAPTRFQSIQNKDLSRPLFEATGDPLVDLDDIMQRNMDNTSMSLFEPYDGPTFAERFINRNN